ncbi:MAG: hypothetical protein ACYC2K_17700, partial [Gemmatimonadales bacterium]
MPLTIRVVDSLGVSVPYAVVDVRPCEWPRACRASAHTILVDGVRAAGTREEGMRGATSIDGRATTSRLTGMAPIDVKEIVNGGAIAAIEVYPSTANAPAELQAAAMGGRGSYGIIAFW